jgi:hypothetical protein
MTCSITAWRRWSASASSIGSGESVNTAWCRHYVEQLAPLIRDDVIRVGVADPAHDRPPGHLRRLGLEVNA